MKKILFVLGIAFLSHQVYAQTASKMPPAPATKSAHVAKTLPAPDQRAVPYSNELKTKLGLNADQYQKVLAVNTECIRRKDQGKAAGKDNGKDISAYRQQQFQSILTAEQMAELKAINAQGGKAAAVKAH